MAEGQAIRQSSSGSATRQELLDAGLHLLRTEGASALRVRRVAEAANCSTMGVYTWFGDKHGLIEALWLDGFRRFGEALIVPSKVEDASERVRELMDTYWRWATDNPADYQLMFGRTAAEYEPSQDARDEAAMTFVVLAEAMRAAQDAGRLRSGEPAEMAIQLWGVAHGLVAIGLADVLPVEVDLQRVYRDAIDVLLAGMAPTGRDTGDHR